MRVHVLLFGPLAEIYGVREEWLDLNGPSSVQDVYQHYARRDARLGRLGHSLHIAVNQAIVRPDHSLSSDDEVALLPPVCGGSAGSDLIELTETALEEHPWRKHPDFSSGAPGAVTIFEGFVRREEEHDPVIALDFDAYRSMALTALAQLAVEARRRWPTQSIVMLHRLGLVPVGQICVIVAVATGHREEAFAACKFLIDTLKATVPIWKREVRAAHSQWVTGTILPAARE